MDRNEKEGNQVLLLSKYVLDAKPYNEELEEVTWETSDIRQWLNNEFYTTAFNKAEKAKIQTSLIKTKITRSMEQAEKTTQRIRCFY